MGSARLRRAVFGVPPNTLECDLGFTERWAEKARSRGRRRDGSEGTRDACAPVSSAWIRLKSVLSPIVLEIASQSASQMKIKTSLQAADGTDIIQEIYRIIRKPGSKIVASLK